MKSQNNEAEIIIKYFNGRTGTLLSLGENDGKTFSNSFDLINLGWSADLVEPGPGAFNTMKALHKGNKNIKCHNFGISNESGKKLFYLTEDSLLASLNKDLALSWKSKYTEVYLDFLDFKSALKKFKFRDYQLISIDCEGMDLEILRQIDLKDLGCECICIEHGHNNYEEMKRICNNHGLQNELLKNYENVIFAK